MTADQLSAADDLVAAKGTTHGLTNPAFTTLNQLQLVAIALSVEPRNIHILHAV
jgi:hypothetical protein